jgi:hypothetical protein
MKARLNRRGADQATVTGRVTFAIPSILPYHDLVFLLLSFRFHWVALR